MVFSPMPIRILIVDDHPLVRSGLKGLLAGQADFEICGEAETVAQAREVVGKTKLDVAIIDLTLKDGNGIELIKEFKAAHSGLKMLALSMHDESLFAERALRAGALGYVNKQAASRTIIRAVRTILTGKLHLSPEMTQRMVQRAFSAGGSGSRSPLEALTDRELEVFEMIGHAMTSREIATRLNLSPKTVETHREHIKEKLELKNAAELTQHAVQWILEKH